MDILKNNRLLVSVIFLIFYILNIVLVRSFTGAAMSGYLVASSVLFTLALGIVLFSLRRPNENSSLNIAEPELNPSLDNNQQLCEKKPLTDDERKLIEALNRHTECLREDISELQRRLRDEYAKNSKKDQMMIRQSRLAAMGEMISNIAHQWRQPLNALALTVQDIEDSYQHNEITDEYIKETVAKSMDLIQHMSVTIDDFRNFYKANKDIVSFSLLKAIDEAMKIISASMKNSNIEVTIDCKEDVIARGYPNEFSQVILNILSNAKDAVIDNTPTGRAIGIVIEKTVSGKGEITISDNGGGIPQGIMDNVFDPYFTTKEQGKGTGIGLYMSKTIIENNMGGRIDIENIPNGTKVIITL
jgi:signal transduction histidine kinase